MFTFFALTFTPRSAGVAPMTFGGVSSYHPPSGCPIRAHDATTATKSRAKPRGASMATLFSLRQLSVGVACRKALC